MSCCSRPSRSRSSSPRRARAAPPEPGGCGLALLPVSETSDPSPTRRRGILDRVGRDHALTVLGAVVAVAAAVALFTRFSTNIKMSRDEGINAYSGQQLAHGLAPYASIFDPKAPLASIIAGLGALAARIAGRAARTSPR